MNTINFHIAYLLTKHECVIIPGIGAFVVSPVEKSKIKETGLLCPPARPLGFNPEIKHNDGLLANSISQKENIAYKEACLRIQHYTDYLNDRLKEQKTIQMQWVGKLALSAKRKIIFAPSIYLSCNASHFGLNNFYLPTLDELDRNTEPVYEKKRKREPACNPVNRNIFRRSSPAAAAVLALFLVSTPLNRQQQPVAHLQQAGFLPVSTKAAGALSTAEETATIPYAAPPAVQPVAQPAENETPNTYRYHIIIASLPNEKSAKARLEELRKDFPEAVFVHSDRNKYRIAIHQFEDKKAAIAFLKKFRTTYPKHADAWMLTQ
ncbi:MAG: SPOR domain-containing protein [Dysgonamonadaceae bacterium]|nr:SPOR domain-containing protein [Dysgonamonadaceae bacterium]